VTDEGLELKGDNHLGGNRRAWHMGLSTEITPKDGNYQLCSNLAPVQESRGARGGCNRVLDFPKRGKSNGSAVPDTFRKGDDDLID